MAIRRRRAFSIPELTLAMAILAILSVMLAATLRSVSRLSLRTTSLDEAMAQILKAKAHLSRDLINSSRVAGQFATAKVGPNLGSGFDGDALTFLSSDDGAGTDQWSMATTGKANMASQLTYYLVIPNTSNPFGVAQVAGPADAAGFEQQFPVKWMIRQVDPVTVPGPAVDPTWTAWLTRPSSNVFPANRRIVAERLFQFRVLQTPPAWSLELSAVAILDARKRVNLGATPLTGSKFVITQQFCAAANN